MNVCGKRPLGPWPERGFEQAAAQQAFLGEPLVEAPEPVLFQEPKPEACLF